METVDLGIDGLDNVELIGRGGSSRVYRARQIDLDRLVALKVINAGNDSDVGRRFDRERKAMGRLSLHEGIVPIYSTGITSRGEPYLIMPYYATGSLQHRMERGPVPWHEAVDYVTAVATTLAAAHQNGVVHLDLKPANILLSASGAPRIADFGIAKLTSDGATRSTGAAFTPSYSSPEALLGEPTSPASDVYGLGATLWALIAGRTPFRDESGDNSLMSVVGRVVHQPVADLRHMAPEPICAVIEMAMAKRPEDRYQTAGAFGQALSQAAEAVTRGAATGTQVAQAAAAGVIATSAPAETVLLNSTIVNGDRTQGPLGREAGNGSSDPTWIDGGWQGPGPDGPPQRHPSGPFQIDGRPEHHSVLQFDDAVPPPFVPAAPGTYDTPDNSRTTWFVLTGGIAVVVVVAVLAALSLSGGSDEPLAENPGSGFSPSEVDTTTARPRGALAGAGGTNPAAPSTAATSASGSSLSSSTTASGTTATTRRPSTSVATTAPATPSSGGSSTNPSTSPSTAPSTTRSTTPTSASPTSGTSTSSPSTTPSTTGSTTTTASTSTSTTEAPPPPGSPTNLSAGVTGGPEPTIRLTWNAPETNPDAVESYAVRRNGVVVATGLNQPRYADNDVTPGETYEYEVRANGLGGNSPWTPPISETVPGSPGAE